MRLFSLIMSVSEILENVSCEIHGRRTRPEISAMDKENLMAATWYLAKARENLESARDTLEKVPLRLR